MTQTLNDFLNMTKVFHEQNRTLEHFARRPGNRASERLTMPLTPFVYQFFLYNSLYQVDWDASLSSNNLEFHKKYNQRMRQGVKEPAQQKRFEQFMRKRDGEAIYLLDAFRSSLNQTELSGDWTQVVSDNRVSQEDGQKFFERMRELREATSISQKTRAGSLYNKVEECRAFVYDVRCNIFHGSKTLGETYEPAQKLRIKVYFMFLHALMSAFFGIIEAEQNIQLLHLESSNKLAN